LNKYPAGRSSPKTYQTRRAWASFVRATESPGTGRRPGLGCTLREVRTLSNSGGTGYTFCCQVLEGRNPLFELRFDGAFLLRVVERTFAS
jgi:hypothetical protein